MIKHYAKMLKSECEFRFYENENCELDCICPFCFKGECLLTDSSDITPADWRIEKAV